MGYRNEEKETILNYSFTEKRWEVWSSVPSHISKMLKKGWTITGKTEENGMITDASFVVPKNAVTFRDLNGKLQKPIKNEGFSEISDADKETIEDE